MNRIFIGTLLLIALLISGCSAKKEKQTPVQEPAQASAKGEVPDGGGRQPQAGSDRGDGGGVFAGDEIVPPIPAPEFNLQDRDGKRLRLKDLRGRLVLVGFVYAGCPDICPRLARSFLTVQKEMNEVLGKDLELVLISVDPEGDTPERVNKWTEAFGGKWHYLIGSRRELEKVWDDYGMVVEKGKSGAVGHSVKTYLIDAQGLARIRYGGLGWEKAALEDIRRLLGR